jgi:RHS repeat-associated protein
VTDTYTYDAWGNLIGRTGSTANTRLFLGEELDPNLGLINLRARQYEVDTGRFTTSDPIDLIDRLAAAGQIPAHDAPGQMAQAFWKTLSTGPEQLERFLYASADPVNRRDPTGRDEALEESETYAPISGTLRQIRIIGGDVDCVVDAIESALDCYRIYAIAGGMGDLLFCTSDIAEDLVLCNARHP